MKHFLEINQLSYEDIKCLLNRASEFKTQDDYPQFHHGTLAHLFYEPSTRTRISFEMAAKNLGMRVITVDIARSSETKGEMIEDTINNLVAMGIRHFVIRHSQDGLPKMIAGGFPPGVHIINAGDGTHEHPSQALLDMMTIIQHKSDIAQLKIAIVGNILHSRVANSFQNLCATLGVGELVMVAPEIWHPHNPVYGRVTSSLQEGIEDADVVMALRVQKERFKSDQSIDVQGYHDSYAITKSRLALAKPDVMIMHPGPINRGVEIDSDVADGPHSYILEQVKNGVFMRMAILEALISSDNGQCP